MESRRYGFRIRRLDVPKARTSGLDQSRRHPIIAKFTSLVRHIANQDLTRTFKILVESSSVLYNYDGQLDIQWKDYYKDDLESVRSFAGTSVLRELERILSNTALAETSLNDLKARFLILFGTIIAVGYSRPVGHNPEVSTLSGETNICGG